MSLVRAGDLPRVMSVESARDHGISAATARTQLRHGSWRRMGAGVLLTRPDPPTPYDWAAAGVLLAGPTAAVSGWEALRIAGLVRGGSDGPQLVLVLTRQHRSRRLGPLLIRRTDRPYASVCTPWEADLPLTPVVSTARAVADTAIALPTLDSVRGIVAAAIQRGQCHADELLAELLACPQQGSGHLRRALAEISAGARSVAEARALVGLQRGDVPSFEMNVPIVDGHDRHVFTVDVLWRTLRAALEIDSAEYHFRRGDWLRTLERHAALTAAGLSVLHLPPSRITPDGAWIAQVARWLDTRATELGLPNRGARGSQLHGEPAPLALPGLHYVR